MKVIITSVNIDIVDTSTYEQYNLQQAGFEVEYKAIGVFGYIEGKQVINMKNKTIAEAEEQIKGNIENEFKSL